MAVYEVNLIVKLYAIFLLKINTTVNLNREEKLWHKLFVDVLEDEGELPILHMTYFSELIKIRDFIEVTTTTTDTKYLSCNFMIKSLPCKSFCRQKRTTKFSSWEMHSSKLKSNLPK